MKRMGTAIFFWAFFLFRKHGGTPPISQLRITEDNQQRITEDGTNRVTE